jgi:deazaflavin-dependent oxidoreductase (nitroreductase family)
MSYLDVADRLWPLLRRATKGHTIAYRATNGLVGHRVPGVPPMLLLDHVGAKSGRRRTSPLVYTRDGNQLVLVASKGGHPRDPAWYHNLVANPETTVQVGSERRSVRARKARPEERGRLWGMVVDNYGGFAGYQERTKRQIPLIVLEPR